MSKIKNCIEQCPLKKIQALVNYNMIIIIVDDTIVTENNPN